MKYLYSFLDGKNNLIDVVEIEGTKYTMDNLGRMRYL